MTSKNRQLAAINRLSALTERVAEFDDASFLTPELRPAQLANEVDELSGKIYAVLDAETAYRHAVTARDAAISRAAALIDRVRCGVKSKYGEESAEYARVGGKPAFGGRRGRRKSPQQTTDPTTPAAPKTEPAK